MRHDEPASTTSPSRRIAVATAIALTTIGAAVVLVRTVWIPNYRPTLQDGERYGVDVSNHQRSIDWERVANDEMTFAYIKASEGGDHVDDSFAGHWTGAGAVGLERGAYHFFTLCRPGAEQAANFLAVLDGRIGELPPAVDLELAGNCSARPDREWVDRELGEFIDIVSAETGQWLVQYTGDDFEKHYTIRDDLDLAIWHRRTMFRADVDDWWIWQVSGWAAIDGIEGQADLNVMRSTDLLPAG